LDTINIPNPDNLHSKAAEILNGMKKGMGMIPNIYAVMGYSENALEAHSQASSLLSKGSFNNKEREAISLAVAEENGCKYCQSAHTAVAKMNGFSDEEIYQLRKGKIEDIRLKCITDLSQNIIQTKGNVNKEILENFFMHGFDNKALIELIALVSLGTLTNYIGKLTNIPIDFPIARD
jgi:uncharacterized peroxidase-related enzyme